MKKSLFTLCAVSLVSAALIGCGAQSETAAESGAEAQLVSGTGRHIINTDNVNVRDNSLQSVLFVVNKGTVFVPTGETKVGNVGGSSYRFYRGFFPAKGQHGWIADNTYVQPITSSIVATVPYNGWVQAIKIAFDGSGRAWMLVNYYAGSETFVCYMRATKDRLYAMSPVG